jgi:hypothetical protein
VLPWHTIRKPLCSCARVYSRLRVEKMSSYGLTSPITILPRRTYYVFGVARDVLLYLRPQGHADSDLKLVGGHSSGMASCPG